MSGADTGRYHGMTDRQVARMRGRVTRRTLTAKSCAAAVGEIPRGGSVFGVSKGQWSLIDLFDHLLEQCGAPADVVISTWAAAMADAECVWQWMRDGRIASCRLILDVSILDRAPAYLEAFRARFGPEAVRLTVNHCKFLLIRGGDRAFSVVTSANLNENRRLEWWDVADDPGRADYLLELSDLIFREVAADEGNRAKLTKAFAVLGESDPEVAAADHARAQRAYFGDGAFDVDVRRAGVVFQR